MHLLISGWTRSGRSSLYVDAAGRAVSLLFMAQANLPFLVWPISIRALGRDSGAGPFTGPVADGLARVTRLGSPGGVATHQTNLDLNSPLLTISSWPGSSGRLLRWEGLTQ